jgi:hypothetical protein
MGQPMSFLLDPPMLVATGATIERLAPDERSARTATRAAVAVFVGTSASLYLNLPVTAPIWRLFRASSGRDFMLRSGLFSGPDPRRRLALDALAVALFCAYPSWLALGRKWARGRPASLKGP